jgi:putative MATE family efflux protein
VEVLSTPTAKFVTGSTFRHVLTMTGAGSVGLVAVFAVDAISLLYISMLGKPELKAAIGFATTVMFFTLSVGIGLAVAASVLTSRALGQGNRALAKDTAASSLLVILVISTLLAILLATFADPVLQAMGAKGKVLVEAKRFMYVQIPSVPLLALGMCLSGLLRAVGDAKRSMWVTLFPAATIVVLDPLLIFTAGLELQGAALALVLARCVMVWIGWRSLSKVHRLVANPSRGAIVQMMRPFLAIGAPAILTQIATPFANAFVTYSMAPFGDDAVAGWAIVSRLIPVSFGVLYALSASVGPIIGQNLGAKKFDRVRSTITDSLRFTIAYCLFMSLVLALFAKPIANAFGAQAQAYQVVVFFCTFIAVSFVFNGMLFVANAAFNTMGYAFYSSILNWGRATIGVLPFAWFGGRWYGAPGVLAGYGAGAVLFGVVAIWLCYRVLNKLTLQAKFVQ